MLRSGIIKYEKFGSFANAFVKYSCWCCWPADLLDIPNEQRCPRRPPARKGSLFGTDFLEILGSRRIRQLTLLAAATRISSKKIRWRKNLTGLSRSLRPVDWRRRRLRISQVVGLIVTLWSSQQFRIAGPNSNPRCHPGSFASQ